MKKENDDYLVNKYPKIFVDRYGDIKKTLMPFGFSCGDGWLWLIDNLCSSIQWRIDNPSWKDGKPIEVPQVVAVQIKEKFGMLRFYVDGGNDETHTMIRFAESLSYSICEICGSTKNVGHTNGWIITICEDCYKKEVELDSNIGKRDFKRIENI